MNSRKRTVIIIAILLGAILVSLLANLVISLIQSASHPKKYEEFVEKYASEYNIPEYVLYAVINVGSEFDASAKSSEGAIGLMQITPEMLKLITSEEHLNTDIKLDELYDPELSISLGAYYLRYLFNKFHKWNTALAAYDAGEEIVLEWLSNVKYSSDGETLKKIPEKETRNYVNKVNKSIDYYKKTYYKNGVSVK